MLVTTTCLVMAQSQCNWPVHSVVSNQEFLKAYEDLDLTRINGLERKTRTITWEQTEEILLELDIPISILPEPTDEVRIFFLFESIPLCRRQCAECRLQCAAAAAVDYQLKYSTDYKVLLF